MIAFISDDDIHIVLPDGTGERALTHTGAKESGPAWSMEGSRLAYTIEGESDIQMIKADGTEGEPIVTSLDGDASAPRWSRDSTRLAFGLFRVDGASIYVMNSDGSGLTEVLHEKGRYPGYVDWSPDGKELVFSAGSSDDETDLYVISADGSHLKQITTEPGVDTTPRWSPDGARIAFFSDRDGGGVFLINPDGSGLEKLIGNPLQARVAHLAWSPDGQDVAFVGEFSGEGNVASPLHVFSRGELVLRKLTEEPVTGSPLSWRSAP